MLLDDKRSANDNDPGSAMETKTRIEEKILDKMIQF